MREAACAVLALSQLKAFFIFSTRCHGLLSAELREAEAKESNDPSAALGVHARRVEALRKRLEGVAYTMSRVQLRLDGLTSVVTKAEDKKRKERSAAASAS